MQYKINGNITLETLQDSFENFFKVLEIDEKTRFISSMDCYIRFEDATGKMDTFLDEYVMVVDLPDRFAPYVLAGLKNNKKQKDIAKDLGISPQRVSKVKNQLVAAKLI